MQVIRDYKFLIIFLLFTTIIILLYIDYGNSVAKRQPYFDFSYIRSEMKKLPEGKDIRLSEVIWQGSITFLINCNQKYEDDELTPLCSSISKIIDEFLLVKTKYNNVNISVIFIYNDIAFHNLLRNKGDENNVDYWNINNEIIPAYTGT